MEQVFRRHVGQGIDVGFVIVQVFRQKSKPRGAGGHPARDDLFQSIESAAAYEENIAGVDLQKFLLRVFAPSLRRHVGHTSLDDLQQFLLHTFAGDVPGNGAVDALFTGYLVQLVDVYDAVLCSGYIPIGGLDQAEQDVLHVLANVSGLGQ